MPCEQDPQPAGCATVQGDPGYILLLVMVFLLLLALIAGTVLRVSALEFRMAGNDQFREQALQQARGIAQALAANPAHFPLDLAVGDSLCGEGTACARPILSAAPAGHSLPENVVVDYRITRMGPRLAPAPGLRLPQAEVSGVAGWRVANFEVQVAIDGSPVALGSARVVQGVALLVPSDWP
ncbi:MAG: hypothetical protein RJQ10_17350 [Haliea sp.]|uniref:hypothetical protein n=1 Tax=Haliea sp. TaxID=1932666 RepID=UPI0032F00C31